MSIDRKKFLMMALSLSLGTINACTPAPAAQKTMPDNTATGDPVDETAAPTDECTDWDPSGECIAWNGESAAPASECVDWDPSGECTQWMPAGEGYAPADECVDWDPSGECIEWAQMGD
jgi:hypothetical protein